MKEFIIRIADFNIKIKAIYEAIYFFCRDYLWEGKNYDFLVSTGKEDILYERKKESAIPLDYPDSYLEILAIYRKIADLLIDKDIILMHGSALSYKGCGILFIADSGVGKSTHAGYWKQLYKSDVIAINDDKPLIKIRNNQSIIYGTPWSGKEGINTNASAPLKMIYCLERGKNNELFDLDNDLIWTYLIKQTYIPSAKDLRQWPL